MTKQASDVCIIQRLTKQSSNWGFSIDLTNCRL